MNNPIEPWELALEAWARATEKVKAPPGWTAAVMASIQRRESSAVWAILRLGRWLAPIAAALALASATSSLYEQVKLEQAISSLELIP